MADLQFNMYSTCYSYYKYCMVPQCLSTSIKTPNKLFIYVPHNEKMRKKWLQLAKRDDAHMLSTASRMYFCEDHFDLPKDMCNFMEYHIMGTVSQVRMKPGCTPSKFECQENRRKRSCSSTESSDILNAECLNKSEDNCTQSSFLNDTSIANSDFQKVQENVVEIKCEPDTSVQAFITHKYRSKAVQTKVKPVDHAPLKPSKKSSFTSPFKVETVIKSKPFVRLKKKYKRNIKEEDLSDSDISINIPPAASSSRSASVHSLQIKSSSD